MTRKRKLDASQKIKEIVSQTFNILRPFEKEYQEQTGRIQARGIEIANLQAGAEITHETLEGISEDLLMAVQSLDAILQRQKKAITELNISSMKLREFEDTPRELGELMIDAATIMANWDLFIQQDVDLLVLSLTSPFQETRQEAIAKLPKSLQEAWINDLLAARSEDA